MMELEMLVKKHPWGIKFRTLHTEIICQPPSLYFHSLAERLHAFPCLFLLCVQAQTESAESRTGGT